MAKGSQAASTGEKLDFATNTPKILSKKINIKPKVIPKAKLTPITPRRFNYATATAIMVKINADTGIL